MAPIWERLGTEWSDHPVGLVAQMDCSTDDESQFCEQLVIEGFPTLMYGDPEHMEVRSLQCCYDKCPLNACVYVYTKTFYCFLRFCSFILQNIALSW
jgi:hypothetical protein